MKKQQFWRLNSGFKKIMSYDAMDNVDQHSKNKL